MILKICLLKQIVTSIKTVFFYGFFIFKRIFMNKFIVLSFVLVCSGYAHAQEQGKVTRGAPVCGTAEFCLSEYYIDGVLAGNQELYPEIANEEKGTTIQKQVVHSFLDNTSTVSFGVCFSDGTCGFVDNEKNALYIYENDKLPSNRRVKRNWLEMFKELAKKGIEIGGRTKAGRSVIDFGSKHAAKAADEAKDIAVKVTAEIRNTPYDIYVSDFADKMLEEHIEKRRREGVLNGTAPRTYHEGRDSISDMSSRIGNGGKIVSGKGKSHGNWAR